MPEHPPDYLTPPCRPSSLKEARSGLLKCERMERVQIRRSADLTLHFDKTRMLIPYDMDSESDHASIVARARPCTASRLHMIFHLIVRVAARFSLKVVYFTLNIYLA
jgi:hypothetical protein